MKQRGGATAAPSSRRRAGTRCAVLSHVENNENLPGPVPILLEILIATILLLGVIAVMVVVMLA